jgi:hypothetical protein
MMSALRKHRSRSEQAVAKRLLGSLRNGDDLRTRKARRLRGAVRAGRYENELKLAIAMQKLIEDL